jgi:hypothetical protein
MALGRLFRPREAAIQSAVVAHWRVLGEPNTLVAAIPNAGAMGQPGLTAGLPDLMIIGPKVPGSCRVGFIELKREARSTMSAAQDEFRGLCRRLDVPHEVCVGRDAPIAVLEAWGIVKRVSHGQS